MKTTTKLMIGVMVCMAVPVSAAVTLIGMVVDEGFKAYGTDYASEVCIGKVEPQVAVDAIMRHSGETALEAYKAFDCEAHLKERATLIKGE